MNISSKMKLKFWKLIYPIFVPVQHTLLRLGLIKHKGRQPFLLGTLKKGRKIEDFIDFIETKGFHNHFIAWPDTGQIISLRKRENFVHQYHLRVFRDGEIRGHYELTPEDKPIAHLMEKTMQPRYAYFLNYIKDWIDLSAQAASGEEPG